jgi:hypothetical protein
MGYQAWNEANSIWQPYFPNFHCSRNDHISDHYIWPTPGKLDNICMLVLYYSILFYTPLYLTLNQQMVPLYLLI